MKSDDAAFLLSLPLRTGAVVLVLGLLLFLMRKLSNPRTEQPFPTSVRKFIRVYFWFMVVVFIAIVIPLAASISYVAVSFALRHHHLGHHAH
jgi:hypothetical protein